MILIEENFDSIIAENSTEGKKLFLSGVFAEAGVKNRNQRTYKLDEMASEVRRINEAAQMNRHVLGELDHPSILDVKLENVSHKIVEMRMQGNKAYGKAEVITGHPKGQILKSLIENGIQVGVSTRGSGQINESTGEVSNFRMVTVDAVATPSCRSAYPETIEESIQLYKRGEIITDLSEAAIHDPAAQKYFADEMRKFISSLYS